MPTINNNYVYEQKLFLCGGKDSVKITTSESAVNLSVQGAYVVDSNGVSSCSFYCNQLCPDDYFLCLRTASQKSNNYEIDNSSVIWTDSTGYNFYNVKITTVNNRIDGSTDYREDLYATDDLVNVLSLYKNFHENCYIKVVCLPVSHLKFVEPEDVIIIKRSTSLYIAPSLGSFMASWTDIEDRPTKLSQFTNDKNYTSVKYKQVITDGTVLGVITIDDVDTSLYFTKTEGGAGLEAGSLTVKNKTAWGLKYWTDKGQPDTVDGDMSNVGNITFKTSKIEVEDNTDELDIKSGKSSNYPIQIIDKNTDDDDCVVLYGLRAYRKDSNVGINTATPTEKLTVNGNVKIGEAILKYDDVNKALYVTDKDGGNVNFYATGGVAAFSNAGAFSTLDNITLKNKLTVKYIENTLDASIGGDVSIKGKLYVGGTSYVNGTFTANDVATFNKSITAKSLSITDGANSIKGTTTIDSLESSNVKISSGSLYVGGTTDAYKITSISSDGTYLNITINGVTKKILFA